MAKLPDFNSLLNSETREVQRHLFNPINNAEQYINNVKWLASRLQQYRADDWQEQAAEYLMQALDPTDHSTWTLPAKSYHHLADVRSRTISALATISATRMMMTSEFPEDFDTNHKVDYDSLVGAWKSLSLTGLTLLLTMTPLEEIVAGDARLLERIKVA